MNNTQTTKTQTQTPNSKPASTPISSMLPQVKQKHKTIFAYLCVFLTILSVILYYTNKSTDISFSYKYYLYLFFTIFPILVGIWILISGTVQNIFSLITPLLIIISILLFANYAVTYLSDNVLGIVHFIFLVLLIVFIVTVFYKLTLKYLNTLNGWSGFLIKFIFYIPCLILELGEYLIDDFNRTTKLIRMIGMLLLLVIVLIILYYIIPYIYRLFKSAKIIRLVDKPIFLNRESIVCDNDTLKYNESFYWFKQKTQRDIIVIGNGGDLYYKNYSISMWILVNADNNVSTETPLFKYGNDLDGTVLGKPAITFNPNNKDPMKPYSVYFSDTRGNDFSKYDFAFIPQKWNYVVITYNGNIVDFFLNGELETSYYFKKTKATPQSSNLPSYTLQDNITVGYGNFNKGTTGINGAMCNAEYHKIPMTKIQVKSNYNIFKKENPPVSW